MLTAERVPAWEQDTLALTLVESTSVLTGVTPREVALLAYADVLTRQPASITGVHIRALRDAGLDDRSIHDACAIVAYFAFVNRIADGLGVELEGSA